MSRAVPTQDSSPESFARLLSRLTHTQASHAAVRDPALDPLAEDYAVSVSISENASAALNAARKRPLAPVRVSAQRANRTAADAGEISYERALRLHSRPRPAELPELPASEAQNTPPSHASRMHTEAKAISALRRASSRSSQGGVIDRSKPNIAQPAEGNPSLGSLKADSPPKPARAVATPDSARSARNRKPGARPSSDKKRTAPSAAPTVASRTPLPRKSRKVTPQALDTIQPSPSRPSATPASPLRTTTTSSSETRHSRARSHEVRRVPVEIAPVPASPPGSLELEVASRPLTLAHRQSIVSIRLNAIESEQLRLRAAESGISVSAYMRSCVLEAEHLRTQVKQALAELRASHALTAAPRLETAPAALLSAHLPDQDTSRAIRSGFLGFLSGVFAIMLGRFQR